MKIIQYDIEKNYIYARISNKEGDTYGAPVRCS